MLVSFKNSLLKEYNKKWECDISPNDFACSKEEFFIALKTALENGKQIEEYIKPKTQINNNNLKNSLNKNTSANTKESAAQVYAASRKDNRANKNIEAIKKQMAINMSEGDNVVTNDIEIRTVQTNKRLKKTRRAVIVRESSERPPKTFLARTFNLFSFVAVGLVAVFLGIFVGNMVVAGKTLVNYDYNEADYIADYQKVYQTNAGLNPQNVKAYDAYVMAEWQINNQSGLIKNYTVSGNGYVKAKVSGIVQSQTITKRVTKTEDKLINESITDGLIPAAERLEYEFSNNTMYSYVTKKISGNPVVASYDKNPTTVYKLDTDLEKYRAEYGVNPNNILPYLVSDKTYDKIYESECKPVDGGYQYKITLNNIYGVINYVQYMIHISGLTRPPTFYELTLTFIVDENYRFKQIYVYERYQIYYMGLPADCTAETTYNYAY